MCLQNYYRITGCLDLDLTSEAITLAGVLRLSDVELIRVRGYWPRKLHLVSWGFMMDKMRRARAEQKQRHPRAQKAAACHRRQAILCPQVRAGATCKCAQWQRHLDRDARRTPGPSCRYRRNAPPQGTVAACLCCGSHCSSREEVRRLRRKTSSIQSIEEQWTEARSVATGTGALQCNGSQHGFTAMGCCRVIF